MQEATVQVKGGELFYASGGQGAPLLLLHSLGFSSEAWRYVIEPLSERFTVYAVDLIGHGDSSKPDKDYEIPHYTESIVEFMDSIGINKARIIGNSIGAMISIEMSVSFPERVVKQVLVGCPSLENIWDRLRVLMFFASLRYYPDGNPKPLTMEELKVSFAHPTKEILERANRLRTKAGLWCQKAQIAVALWDIKSRLPLVNCPTLIVSGSKDFACKQDKLLRQNIRGAKYALIEDTGHLPQIDDPEAFLKAVSSFL